MKNGSQRVIDHQNGRALCRHRRRRQRHRRRRWRLSIQSFALLSNDIGGGSLQLEYNADEDSFLLGPSGVCPNVPLLPPSTFGRN